MDVETAFLNGLVSSVVYVSQPPGYENGKNKVCKLVKSLYALKESTRSWYERLNDYVVELGFIRSKYDYCLYSTFVNCLETFIILFVDYLLLCSEKMDIISEIKKKLSCKFKMKDLGKAKTYVVTFHFSKSSGIQIEWKSFFKNF